jgi:hypothetical protein
MRRGITIVILALGLTAATVHAQLRTPSVAMAYYEEGIKKVEKGDLEGAIQDFTRAIELSSSLLPRKGFRANSWRNEKDFGGAARTADRVSVVDPFTANAYSNRCFARYKKNDFEGAVAEAGAIRW